MSSLLDVLGMSGAWFDPRSGTLLLVSDCWCVVPGMGPAGMAEISEVRFDPTFEILILVLGPWDAVVEVERTEGEGVSPKLDVWFEPTVRSVLVLTLGSDTGLELCVGSGSL